ncbi:MAG: hypothetical protein ACRDKT_04895 [Actinomycetota bacterium]
MPEDRRAASESNVKAKLLQQIHVVLNQEQNSQSLLRLAEAYAWVVRPGQPHGGGQAGS